MAWTNTRRCRPNGDPDGDIFVTNDIGCFSAPCDFTAPLTSRISARFLTCQSPVALAGYVGDPAVECTVTGSPTGFNAFKVEQITGPGGAVVSGGINGQTNLFSVTGKLRAALPPPPPPSASVPNVAGLLLADGLNSVVAAGFNIGLDHARVERDRRSRADHQPVAGSRRFADAACRRLGDGVDGLAGSITVPNVVNLAQAAANAAITGAGLVVGTITTASSATVPSGSVISQSPTRRHRGVGRQRGCAADLVRAGQRHRAERGQPHAGGGQLGDHGCGPRRRRDHQRQQCDGSGWQRDQPEPGGGR